MQYNVAFTDAPKGVHIDQWVNLMRPDSTGRGLSGSARYDLIMPGADIVIYQAANCRCDVSRFYEALTPRTDKHKWFVCRQESDGSWGEITPLG